jgi:16S rRNA (cytidine1402-2'-O)-methyltransferase
MSRALASGRLLLVPTPLDFGIDAATHPTDIQDALPLGVIRQAAALTHWVAENARSARAFLKRVDAVVPLAHPLQTLHIVELPRPPKGSPAGREPADLSPLLAPALQGNDIGLVSEAGLPAVADPGAALVQQAHELGITVVPLPGASALLLGLAASGMNGQSFAFVGYLPQEVGARAARLRELEVLSRRSVQTQLMIETPYRNRALLDTMLAVLQPATLLSISCGVGVASGWTRTDKVAGWRARPSEIATNVPAIFALQAA